VHVPGTEHADQLPTSLGAGLALAALCAADSERRSKRLPARTRYIPTLELVLGGAIAYALIELTEGHAPLGAGVSPLAILAASVFIVSGVTRLIAGLLRLSGELSAALAPSTSLPIDPLVVRMVRCSRIEYVPL